ncbi:hypothetical protein KAR02_02220, partial [Candidatus Bipolaricaulota bacterium]|nr:hypothetical protein [Candidatus Bipolaricaulota bacterium]
MTMMKRRILSLSGVAILLLIGGCASQPLLPVADFTASSTADILSLVVTFDASLSQAPNGTIVEYSWDFGDG